MSVDELFDVRNALHIGAFQQCINEAQRADVGSDSKDECNTLMYRAMVAQGKYSMVKSEIGSDASSDQQAVKRLAKYMHRKGDREEVVAEVKKAQEDGISMSNPTVALMSGTVFYLAGQPDEALRCLKHSGAESMETLALATQVLISMDRPDQAGKELKKMKEMDDDSTLCKLAESWVGLAKGGELLKEAFYNFEELAQKYGETPTLLNGQAAAHIQQGQYEDAEGVLLTAQEKDPDDAETLINLNSVASFLGKPAEVGQRYLAQLKDQHPNHPFTVALLAQEEAFEKLCE
eukprot:gene5097-12901_t